MNGPDPNPPSVGTPTRIIPFSKWECGLSLVVLCLIGVLLFLRLGDRPILGDEAETSILARNILRYGIPKTNDGLNTLTLFGTEIDNNADGVWIWSPWLDEYAVAASFLVFGTNPWSARFPGAFFGMLSVVALGGLLWSRHRSFRSCLMGMAGLGFMELFLLHARQARYCSLLILGQIILIAGLDGVWRGNRQGKFLIALGFLCQFYCNYTVCVANSFALALLICFGFRKQRFLDLVIAVGLIFLGALPWLLYAQPWGQSGELGIDPYGLKLQHFSLETHFQILPLFLLLAPVCFRHNSPAGQIRTGIGFGVVLFFVAFLLFTPLVPGGHLRYLLPLFPLSVLLIVECIDRLPVSEGSRWFLFLIFGLSNLPAWGTAWFLVPNRPYQLPLANLLGEITHDYVDQSEVLVEYLNKHSKPGESLLSPDPEFGLIFHSHLRVLDARLLKSLPIPDPDWIAPVPISGGLPTMLDGRYGHLAARYQPIGIDVPESKYGGNVPDPEFREFRTAPRRTRFILYKKMSK